MRKPALRYVAGLFLLLLTQQASAATWFTQASVPVGLEYDSNPGLSSSNKQAILRKTISPSINLSAVKGLNQWNAGMVMRIERTSNPTVSQDRQDPSLTFGWQRELERGQLGINAKYDEKSIRTSELEDTGLVRNDGTRTDKSLAVNWSRALTERVRLALNGSYKTISFSGGSNGSNLIGNSSEAAGASLSYALSERAEPYVRLALSRFEPDDGAPSTKHQTGHVGFRWVASERLSWDIHGGMTRSTTGGVSTAGWDGGAHLSYTTERTTTNIDSMHTTSSSGSLSSQESQRITGSWSYSLSELDQAGARFSWVQNKSDDASENRQISLFYARELSDLWKLNVNYLHRQRQTTSEEASGDILGVTLTYSSPNFY